MGYEKDPDRDEDENPLTFDDVDSEEDDPQEDDGDTWRRQERSPTPVYNDDGKSKPRKRLVKKISVAKGLVDEDEVSGFDDVADDVPGFDDVAEEEEEEEGGYDEVAAMGKRKKFSSASSSKGKGFDDVADEEVEGYDDVAEEEEGGYDEVAAMGKRKKFSSSSSKGKKKRRESGFSGGDDVEKEMWDTVAGNDSEDDQNGERTMDDENFIDDTGVDPADRYGSDNERGSPINAPQAEEGEEEDEIQKLFKSGKKKKKSEKSAGEIALLVENVMAELEVVAEEDAELNRRSKPAINKLIKLPFLTDVLSKKQLQQEFLDHGVLTLLKNWLEPLPDGSLPNINIREAILRILTDFPIDLDQHDRREQLKRSGLGKVIMFLSKTDEETTTNRKLAKDLVDKWSRPIFNKSTRFEDMRNYEDERVPSRRPIVRKPTNKAPGMQSRDPDLDEAEFSQRKKSGQASSSVRGLTTRPEAMALDFMVRPQSKIDPDEVRARAKQIIQDQRRIKMQKKLTQLKAPKKKQLQATKLSVEGRGMVKYL